MTRPLYPKIATFKQEWLVVSPQHQLYVEQSGQEDGIPVLYLHGGPGAGSHENYRRYFDPGKYRIILFDQRGCGKSRPSPSIDNNTLNDLIDDIEKLRSHLGIDKWLITAGSWGVTLALSYALRHKDNILGFVFRGVFLGEQQELKWLYHKDGAARFFPEYYTEFLSHLPENLRQNPIKGYYQRLFCDNEVAAIAASKAWFLWELRLSSIEQQHICLDSIEDTHQALCMAKASCHYFYHQCFIEQPILEQVTQISDLPAIVVHGRYDMVCQLNSAYRLVENWPNATLQILPCAGHSGFERQTIDAFCKATDTMAQFIEETR